MTEQTLDRAKLIKQGYSHLCRRHCKGDEDATEWRPIKPEEALRRRADPSFDVVDIINEEGDAPITHNQTEAMRRFFLTYAGEIEGKLNGMSQAQLREHLEDDIFIRCAASATGIAEHTFVDYAVAHVGSLSPAPGVAV